MNRVVKQIIYGTLFLIIIIAIVGGAWWLFQPAESCSDGIQNQGEEAIDCGGPCASCALKEAERLLVQPAEVFSFGGRTVVFYNIINPNSALGISRLPYTIKLLDENQVELTTINGTTFIYPERPKFIIEPIAGIAVDDIKTAGINLDYNISSWDESFSAPPLELVDTGNIIDESGVVVTGTAINDNDFALEEAIITVLLINDLGVRLAASKSALGELAAFSERKFKITIPVGDMDLEGVSVQIFGEARR